MSKKCYRQTKCSQMNAYVQTQHCWTFFYNIYHLWSIQQMTRNARKGPFLQFVDKASPDQPAHLPSVSAYRINRYCSLCRRTENAQIRLHVCAYWSCPSLFANGRKAFFSKRAFILQQCKQICIRNHHPPPLAPSPHLPTSSHTSVSVEFDFSR